MNCFYSNEMVSGAVRLNDMDAQHAVKSLRLRDGDNIVLVYNGQRYAASLELRGRDVYAHPTVPLPGTEPDTRVTLYQGLVKGDKMDDVIRMCTSAAPASRSKRTSLRVVLPRTIESSTTTSRFPAMARFSGLSFRRMPCWRMVWLGEMKVRPM